MGHSTPNIHCRAITSIASDTLERHVELLLGKSTPVVGLTSLVPLVSFRTPPISVSVTLPTGCPRTCQLGSWKRILPVVSELLSGRVTVVGDD